MNGERGDLVAVQSMISTGATRQEIVERLMEDGMPKNRAGGLYYTALRNLTQDPDFVSAHKREMLARNLARLEQIVDSSMEGNAADRTVALKAIDTINKLFGLVGPENGVTIAKKGDEEVIHITFDS